MPRKVTEEVFIPISDFSSGRMKSGSFLFSPVIRYFWQGKWSGDLIEPRRRLFDCELVYVSKGGYNLEIEGSRYRMRENYVAIIPPGIFHESRTLRHDHALRHCIHFDWVPGPATPHKPIQSFIGESFDKNLVNPVPPEIAKHLPMVVNLKKYPELVELIQDFVKQLRSKGPLSSLKLWPVLNALLMLDSPRVHKKDFQNKTSRQVFMVRDFINENYARPQNYDTYLDLTKLSGSHICQAFSSLIGKPPLAYLNDIRLHHACRLLRETSMSSKEIAETVGIPDHNYFTRLFRKKFSRSPIKYRISYHNSSSG